MANDIVAMFVAEFHATKGNIIEWSRVADSGFTLDNVEYSVFPSGAHAVERDVIYFTKNDPRTGSAHQGVAAFRRIATSEVGARGARLISVGILVAAAERPRPWRHIPVLKQLSTHLESGLADKQPLEEYFESHKVQTDASRPVERWDGWEEELSQATMDHPAFHISHVLRILGISSLTIFKHALGRRRILIHTYPPVESACLLAQLAAVISSGEEADSGVHQDRIKVLGVVGLMDLDRIEDENKRGSGWIACTTDAIMIQKPELFDLVIDLTSPPQGKPGRPALSISKRSTDESNKTTTKLQSVRFTWSDVKLWSELERALGTSNEPHSHVHANPQNMPPGKGPWIDPWQWYEDVCLVCAGIWSGWRATQPPSLNDDSSERQRSSSRSSSSSPPRTSSSALVPQVEMNKSVTRQSADPRLAFLPTYPSTKTRVTTLTLLSIFHNHTAFLMDRLRHIIPHDATPDDPIVIGPKHVMTLELGPLSDLDARFVEWLAEVKGKKLKVRNGWKDLLEYILGLS